MRDKSNNKGYATDYTLHVSGYSCTAGNSFAYHNLMKFTTKDDDKMLVIGVAVIIVVLNLLLHGSIMDCYYSNLNGHYGIDTVDGIVWHHWKGAAYSLPYVKTKYVIFNKTCAHYYLLINDIIVII